MEPIRLWGAPERLSGDQESHRFPALRLLFHRIAVERRGLRLLVAVARIKFLYWQQWQVTTASNRPEPGEEQTPFLFVPRGEAPPADWLARHPGWISFPAALVPRRDGNPGDGDDSAWRSGSSHTSSGRWKRGKPELVSSHLARLLASQDGIAFPRDSATDGDPIAAYRTMNRMSEA